MVDSFASRLIRWQKQHGRHDLPWQGADAYGVWLSEIMLQQTQVATVVPYYLRFMQTFPHIAALAAASEEQVLAHWSGLGYYARGRNLHKAARQIMAQHGGVFPRDFEHLLALPGVGRSTAAAISALAWHEPRAILDGNVKRVLTRYLGIDGWPGERLVEQRLWAEAEALLPRTEVATYTQALMDMGATICTRSKPQCGTCPVRDGCVAWHSERVAQLPAARPRKTLPERHTIFLLLRRGTELWLERRPAIGIWGGLWCVPQLEESAAVAGYVARQGMTVVAQHTLPPFSHTFTHFRLHIQPLLLEIGDAPVSCAEPGMMWLGIEQALAAAIPTPLRRVLLALRTG